MTDSVGNDDRGSAGDALEVASAATGGAWLTYRYRIGGEDTPGATGTIKAPSFLAAAHRILARGLDASVGSSPAYLRLRAAGEQEVLFRVERTEADNTAPPRLDVVPNASYCFAEADPQSIDPTSPSA